MKMHFHSHSWYNVYGYSTLQFLPEDVFVSKPLSLALLALHLIFLGVFATKWLQSSKKQTGCYLHLPSKTGSKSLSPQYITCTMFFSNYIGICFSRTLHYQFYAWYFHTLPFLLWSTTMTIPLRVMIMFFIEVAFNVFPATWWSSLVLQISHFTLLVYLMAMEVPPMYLSNERAKAAKHNKIGKSKADVVMFQLFYVSFAKCEYRQLQNSNLSRFENEVVDPVNSIVIGQRNTKYNYMINDIVDVTLSLKIDKN